MQQQNPMMMMGAAQPQMDYNPDYFEYDDELPEGEIGERVILSNDPVPRELGFVKTIGTKKAGGFDNDQEGYHEWAEGSDEEDEARIEAFLNSHKEKPKKKMCTFFMTNSCKNGAKCPFSHDLDDE